MRPWAGRAKLNPKSRGSVANATRRGRTREKITGRLMGGRGGKAKSGRGEGCAAERRAPTSRRQALH
eukprot:717985-Pyramimonas_sp.AAC.1